MYIEENLIKWEELHKESYARLVYPNENIIRFVKTYFPDKAHSRILDSGCGAGRHVVFLAKEGYQTTGIDFSKEAIESARDALNQDLLQATLVQGSILELPFAENSFDGLICYGVLYYFNATDVKKAVGEIYRTLKVGGKAFIVVRNCRDRRYGKGSEIEKNTFIMDSDFSNEQGFLIHFFEKEELMELFSKFSKLTIGTIQESIDSLEQLNSDYLVTVMK